MGGSGFRSGYSVLSQSQGHGAVSKFVISKDGDPLFLRLIVGSAVMLLAQKKICQEDPDPCGLSTEKCMWGAKGGETVRELHWETGTVC